MVPNSQHGLEYNEILFHLNGWISVHPSFDFSFFSFKASLSTQVSGPDYSTRRKHPQWDFWGCFRDQQCLAWLSSKYSTLLGEGVENYPVGLSSHQSHLHLCKRSCKTFIGGTKADVDSNNTMRDGPQGWHQGRQSPMPILLHTKTPGRPQFFPVCNNTVNINCWVSHILPMFCRPACERGAANDGLNPSRTAELFFSFSDPEPWCNIILSDTPSHSRR